MCPQVRTPRYVNHVTTDTSHLAMREYYVVALGKIDADTEWLVRDQCGECQANTDLEKSHFCCNYVTN